MMLRTEQLYGRAAPPRITHLLQAPTQGRAQPGFVVCWFKRPHSAASFAAAKSSGNNLNADITG